MEQVPKHIFLHACTTMEDDANALPELTFLAAWTFMIETLYCKSIFDICCLLHHIIFACSLFLHVLFIFNNMEIRCISHIVDFKTSLLIFCQSSCCISHTVELRFLFLSALFVFTLMPLTCTYCLKEMQATELSFVGYYSVVYLFIYIVLLRLRWAT